MDWGWFIFALLVAFFLGWCTGVYHIINEVKNGLVTFGGEVWRAHKIHPREPGQL